MTKITWAVASTIAALAAACTTEVVDGANDGGTATATVIGAGGAAGTSTSTGSSGSGTTGGSGGASGDAGAEICTAKAGDSACRSCALEKCHDEVCGCESNLACAPHADDFYACLSSPGGTLGDCATTFSTQSNAIGGNIVDGGGSWSRDLGTCMNDCEDRCQGRDAGPRR